LLEAEGFVNRGLVDVFDAGPVLTVRKERIRTFRRSRCVTVRLGTSPVPAEVPALVSTERLPDFRVTACSIGIDGDHAWVGEEAARALGVGTGDRARIWVVS
jgi:arginine N-succinyltransferase